LRFFCCDWPKIHIAKRDVVDRAIVGVARGRCAPTLRIEIGFHIGVRDEAADVSFRAIVSKGRGSGSLLLASDPYSLGRSCGPGNVGPRAPSIISCRERHQWLDPGNGSARACDLPPVAPLRFPLGTFKRIQNEVLGARDSMGSPRKPRIDASHQSLRSQRDWHHCANFMHAGPD